jgi:hypothetical protein
MLFSAKFSAMSKKLQRTPLARRYTTGAGSIPASRNAINKKVSNKMRNNSPITKANLANKYIRITPLGEVRLTCGKNIFRLHKKVGTHNAELTSEYLAQTLRNIIIAESGNIAEDNVRLHDLLYCVKHACIELRDNPDQVSISDVLSIFNEYEDVLPGKDSPYPIHNED